MPTTIVVSECDDGTRVRAHVGDTIEVHLPENASTGYRWALDGIDAGMFELRQSDADYPEGLIGAGGEALFRITIRGPGTATLRLKYWRHWEGDHGVRKRFTVDIESKA